MSGNGYERGEPDRQGSPTGEALDGAASTTDTRGDRQPGVPARTDADREGAAEEAMERATSALGQDEEGR